MAIQGEAELFNGAEAGVIVVAGRNGFQGGSRKAGFLGEEFIRHSLARPMAVIIHGLS